MAKGPPRLVISFGAANLTHFGGLYLLHRFLTRIGIKAAVAKEVAFQQRDNRHTVGELLMAVWYPMLMGLERLETTQLLRQNGVFQYLTGLRTYPDPTALRRFLLRAAPLALPKLRKLHERFLALMAIRLHRPSRVILDIDSTVLVLYGKQEGAKIGYNPIKRGGRRTTRCCASTARARTSGTASCARAMHTLPAARWICSAPAFPRSPPVCGR